MGAVSRWLTVPATVTVAYGALKSGGIASAPGMNSGTLRRCVKPTMQTDNGF